ncbi:hypothetical protein D3C76_1547870 [compost metagenome]
MGKRGKYVQFLVIQRMDYGRTAEHLQQTERNRSYSQHPQLRQLFISPERQMTQYSYQNKQQRCRHPVHEHNAHAAAELRNPFPVAERPAGTASL